MSGGCCRNTKGQRGEGHEGVGQAVNGRNGAVVPPLQGLDGLQRLGSQGVAGALWAAASLSGLLVVWPIRGGPDPGHP